MEEILITISGLNASGKSRMLYLIKEHLKNKGFDVKFINNGDYLSEQHFDKSMIVGIGPCIEHLSLTRIVKIKEEQSSRRIENFLNELGDEYLERYLRKKKLSKLNKV